MLFELAAAAVAACAAAWAAWQAREAWNTWGAWGAWGALAPRREPPTLAGRLPVLGHARRFMGDGVQMYRSMVSICDECTEKGGVVTMYLGFNKIYGLTDPDDCLTIMNTCFDKTLFMKFGKQFLGDGLLTADVERWHTSRRLLNPAFNQKVLDGFLPVFDAQARALLRQLERESGGGVPFDQEKYLRIHILKTICSTLFATEEAECGALQGQYLPLLSAVLQAVDRRMQNLFLHSDLVYRLSGRRKQLDDLIQKLVALSNMMVEKNKLKKQNSPNNNTDAGKPKIFIDLLLELSEESGWFFARQVREEVDTVLLGGHDSTASTLALALALLGAHQPVQDTLYREITEVCGSSERSVTKEDLSKLVYTEAVLKETLRLYPAGPLLPRRVHTDVRLKNYTIKANSDCLIMAHGLHRHRVWGPEPDRFRPERWLRGGGGGGASPDLKYYAVFGLGRRACIGKAYAMMLMKTVLVHVVRRFLVSAAGRPQLSLQLLARPHEGHYIQLHKR